MYSNEKGTILQEEHLQENNLARTGGTFFFKLEQQSLRNTQQMKSTEWCEYGFVFNDQHGNTVQSIVTQATGQSDFNTKKSRAP